MTGYTDERGYPYPSSEREAGNGGLASEALARAVAADLDVIDAGWAAELQHSTIILSMTSDLSPLSANIAYSVGMTTIDKQTTGLGLAYSGGVGLRLAPGFAGGWFHVTAQSHSKANGTITAGAQHRLQLDHLFNQYGGYVSKRMYYAQSFQAGALDMYNTAEGVMHIVPGDEVWMRFFHTNAGSDARVVAAGTRITATLIVADS